MAEQIDHGFSIETNDDGSVVRLGIKGAGIGGGAYFGFVFAAFLIAGLIALGFQSGFVFFLLFAAITGLAIFMDARRKRTYEFEITPTAIRLPDGREYDKADISELLVRNKAGRATQTVSVDRGGVIVGGTGITGVAMAGGMALGNASKQMGAAAGQAIAESMAKRGYAVAIRHGRKVISLANYLKEDDAVSLFNKTAELLEV